MSPRNYFVHAVVAVIARCGGVTRSSGRAFHPQTGRGDLHPRLRPTSDRQQPLDDQAVDSGALRPSGRTRAVSKSTVAEDLGVEEIVTCCGTTTWWWAWAQPSTFIPAWPNYARRFEGERPAEDPQTLMDCIEAANILPTRRLGQLADLLSVWCGGRPTGVEVAGELGLHRPGLEAWIPEMAGELKVTSGPGQRAPTCSNKSGLTTQRKSLGPQHRPQDQHHQSK